MPLNIPQQSTCLSPTCPLPELKYVPLLDERLHWRSPISCSDNEPVLRRFSYTAGTINLRSSASCPPLCIDTYAPAGHTWMRPPEARLGVFICGSFFAEAPGINCSGFIKVGTSQRSSHQSYHIFINNTFSGLGTTLYTDRMKSSQALEMHTEIQEVKYGILFNSKKE